MKAYVHSGADVYDTPVRATAKKVSYLPPGVTVDILESCGDFYAVRVSGRSDPVYIRPADVNMVGAAAEKSVRVATPEEEKERKRRELSRKLADFTVGQLSQGTDKRSIVEQLVAAGWSRDWAVQYVDGTESAIRKYKEEARRDTREEGMSRYVEHIVKGGLLCVAGGLLTGITYALAAPGGTYFVLSGTGIGVIWFLYGLIGWLGTALKK